MAENENKKVLNMADRRKAIREIYSTDEDLLSKLGKTSIGSSVLNRETLKRVLDSAARRNRNVDDVIKLSELVYATEPTFTGIIDYLANMYLWRYYYIPVQTKADKKSSAKEYQEAYQMMTEVIDGLLIEVNFPRILTKLLKEGVVFLYTVRDTAAKTINTITLPAKFCYTEMSSQYGTGLYSFNLKYFDSFGIREDEMEDFLALYPDELASAYREFKNGSGEQRITLDGKYSTFIQLNDLNFPNKLSLLQSLIDFHEYRQNEVEKNELELDMVLTHRIPTYEDRLLFELPEVQDLHRTMSKMLSGNKRLRLLTSFGDTSLHPLQPKSSIQNETLKKAYEAIYFPSGMNINLFSGATKDALETSLARDASEMWKYIQELVNFYNLTINNLFNFKNYQLQLSMVPITHYNHQKQMELHRRNAEFGVGKLELIVASGTKQQHIQSKAEVEDYLKLEEILKPLRSSHTQSLKDQEVEVKKEEEPEEQQPEEEKEDSEKMILR